ncbi:MAG: hypothetical protein IPH07_13620 [Deltaproteobacteria bacterium]|nr:hypothetical protein [Deltaproteobacteria bacterium]MBK8716882.1 hypothetical protein [Deltaproteobacteria bacterium]MBP7286986.1 hypothetical protein [Nannocystaceae bacterium]
MLSLLCLVAVATPSTALAHASTAITIAAPAQVPVDVDLAGLEPLDPEVRAELTGSIAKRAAEVIAKHGLPRDHVHIDVTWRDAANFDYLVKLAFDAHDGVPASSHSASTGPDAKQSDLDEVAAQALERYLAEWTSAHEQAVAANPSKPPAATTATPPPTSSTARGPGKRTRLGGMGWAGVGIIAGGMGALGGGVALLTLNATDSPDNVLKLRNWRPAGIGLAAAGGATVVVGVVLAAVGASRQRKRDANAFAPWIGPGMAGLSLARRF